jgi:hypothetical protein
MMTIFGDFDQFSEKKQLEIFLKATVEIILSTLIAEF